MELVEFLKKTLNREQFEAMVLRYAVSDVWENIGIIEYSNDYSDYRLWLTKTVPVKYLSKAKNLDGDRELR